MKCSDFLRYGEDLVNDGKEPDKIFPPGWPEGFRLAAEQHRNDIEENLMFGSFDPAIVASSSTHVDI